MSASAWNRLKKAVSAFLYYNGIKSLNPFTKLVMRTDRAIRWRLTFRNAEAGNDTKTRQEIETVLEGLQIFIPELKCEIKS